MGVKNRTAIKRSRLSFSPVLRGFGQRTVLLSSVPVINSSYHFVAAHLVQAVVKGNCDGYNLHDCCTVCHTISPTVGVRVPAVTTGDLHLMKKATDTEILKRRILI